MSKNDYIRFKSDLTKNKELQMEVKKVSDVEGLIELALRFGYSFSKDDMAEA